MPIQLNTAKDSNGEILTGKLWRKGHPFFHGLPFRSNIPRMDDMKESLEISLGECQGGSYKLLLVVSFLFFVNAF